MSQVLRNLLHEMTPDSLREAHGFSPEVREANSKLFAAKSERECETHVAAWLQEYQPCLFGRVAAQRGLLSYCIIHEGDLDRGDDYVRTKIQEARTTWSREAYEGRRSGFVIAVINPSLANAEPNKIVGAFARELCRMYLLEDIDFDKIYLDNLRLEAPLPNRATWEWQVGVNYFCAHGDGRWWHDHRVPGGMALSMNSVGHMVKSTVVSQALAPLQTKLGVADPELADGKVDSLGKALKLAMMTINRAATTPSGRATWLLPIGPPSEMPRCPVTLPPEVADKDFCEYAGYYHTDVTLPSTYFRPDVNRPSNIESLRLDFTYLFDDAESNPDWVRMGKGRRIRQTDSDAREDVSPLSRRGKAHGRIVSTQGS